jgi:hypothetical protein
MSVLLSDAHDNPAASRVMLVSQNRASCGITACGGTVVYSGVVLLICCPVHCCRRIGPAQQLLRRAQGPARWFQLTLPWPQPLLQVRSLKPVRRAACCGQHLLGLQSQLHHAPPCSDILGCGGFSLTTQCTLLCDTSGCHISKLPCAPRHVICSMWPLTFGCRCMLY